MLTKVRFENYRCLRKVTIGLGPLTVLVGPNASGKSAVLRALDPGYSLTPADIWRHSQATLEIELTGANGKAFLRRLQEGQVSGRGSLVGFSSAQVLHLDLQKLRNPNQVTESTTLEASGSNLTNVFATLPRKLQDEVAKRLAVLVPAFADVTPRPTSQGNHHLVFQDAWDKNTWYTSREVSDGTMLVLAYLVTQYQNPQVDLLAIEEPERGVHPFLLGELVGFFRKMTKGEVGPKPVQIVIATHSAELLDNVDPSEVRLLSRKDEDGSVAVETVPSDSQEWKAAFREYSGLGSAWLSGGIGGVPRT